MLPIALLSLAAAPAHPESLSTTLVVVRGNEASVTVRCQALSLLEVIEDLDADGNGSVESAEVEARSGEILAYVAGHYALHVGTDRDLRGGVRLQPRPVSASRVLSELAAPIGTADGGTRYAQEGVDVELSYSSSAPIRDLMLEVTLFAATSPGHIDLTTLAWPDGSTETFRLDAGSPRARSDPTGRGAFGVFLGLGWHHILGGWDHLAFLVALVLASRRLRSLLWVVTAFTVAHSITLGLASFRVVDVSRHMSFIEAAIALSIAYVAAETLLQPRQSRSRWPEAFVFGLVHGLGFASFLARSLLREQAKLVALFAFNLGVELGQVAIVTALALALRFLPRRTEVAEPFLAPLRLRQLGSASVAVLGLYWFWQRA